MKKIISAILVAVMVSCSVIGFCGSETFAATSIAEDQANLSKLEVQKNATAAQRNQIKKTISDLKGQYENNYQKKLILENSIQLAEAEIQTVEDLIAGYEARLQELSEERYEQDAQLDEYYAIYSKILNYYYRYGDTGSFEMLLSADSITDFLTRLDYLKYVMEYNNTITDSIKIAKENIVATSSLYAEAQDKLTAEREGLVVTRAELETQITELDELNSSIKGNLAMSEEQVRQLQSVTDKLNQEIADLNKQITEKYIYTETSYAWPIDSVYWSDPNVVITCKYGWRVNPVTDKNEMHNGLDIKAPKGTPIQAAKSGTVVRSENSGGWGNVIVIAHGDGTSTLYAHCDKLLVSKGATVMQGQVIARVGSTGQSTGYHLHFTIYKGSETVNPVDYLDENFIRILNKRGLSLK